MRDPPWQRCRDSVALVRGCQDAHDLAARLAAEGWDLRSDVDSDPAGRAQGPVAFGRAPAFVAALGRGPARPFTPLASARITGHPYSLAPVEPWAQAGEAAR